MTALRRRGTDVLRAAAPGATAPLDLACFPLVPYANRIADGRFAFDGRTHEIPRNYPGQQHPLHGVGWLVPWRVLSADRTSARLVHAHRGDAAWPWPYRAEQRVTLHPDGIAMTLAVTAAEAMPVSIGFHPYFARASARTLAFEAGAVWRVDDAVLPSELVAADALGDWRHGGALERGDLIDNSYVGWGGTARIGRADGDVLLTASGADVLHLYLPPGEAFFCAEPVTAMPDAVNRAPERLAAGVTRTVTMRISEA